MCAGCTVMETSYRHFPSRQRQHLLPSRLWMSIYWKENSGALLLTPAEEKSSTTSNRGLTPILEFYFQFDVTPIFRIF